MHVRFLSGIMQSRVSNKQIILQISAEKKTHDHTTHSRRHVLGVLSSHLERERGEKHPYIGCRYCC